MNTQKLLAFTLTIILVAGYGPSAFADSSVGKAPINTITPQELVSPSSHDNVIFDNNGALPDPNNGNEMTQWLQTEDFALPEDQFVTDVHFIMFAFDNNAWDGSLEYWIFADDAGNPGTILQSGQAANLMTIPLGDGPFGPRTEVWFDTQAPFLAQAGVTYHLGLHANTNDNYQNRADIYWEMSTPGFGTTGIESFGGTMDNWFNNGQEHYFLLTGGDKKVGGEFLPIDSTALLVAGAQTNAVWILTALAGIASAAFGTLYLTSKRN